MSRPAGTIGLLLRRILTVVLLFLSAVLVIVGGVLLTTNPSPGSTPSRIAAGVGVDALVLGIVLGALTLYAAWPLRKDRPADPPRGQRPYR